MTDRERYIADPCGTLSIPYWKNRAINVPADMRIVHHRDYDRARYSAYQDETYFRLYHSLEHIPTFALDGYCIREAGAQDVPALANVINRSYVDLHVAEKQLRACMETPVYRPALWVMVRRQSDDLLVGCGIAEFDADVREGVLEWIQVLPEFRRQGVGMLIVNTLLTRLSAMADFATVSGKVCSQSRPELLYRKCGFTGNDIWHILKKK